MSCVHSRMSCDHPRTGCVYSTHARRRWRLYCAFTAPLLRNICSAIARRFFLTCSKFDVARSARGVCLAHLGDSTTTVRYRLLWGELGDPSHFITLFNTYTSYIIRLLVNSPCIIVLLHTILGINDSTAHDYLCYWYQVLTRTTYRILDFIFGQHLQDSHGKRFSDRRHYVIKRNWRLR